MTLMLSETSGEMHRCRLSDIDSDRDSLKDIAEWKSRHAHWQSKNPHSLTTHPVSNADTQQSGYSSHLSSHRLTHFIQRQTHIKRHCRPDLHLLRHRHCPLHMHMQKCRKLACAWCHAGTCTGNNHCLMYVQAFSVAGANTTIGRIMPIPRHWSSVAQPWQKRISVTQRLDSAAL